MSIPAQKAKVAVALQPALVGKTGDSGFDPADYTYTGFDAVSASTQIMEDIRNLPFRIGGRSTIEGIFKAGAGFAGQMQMLVTPQNTLGHILYGLLGNVDTTLDAVVAGVNRHVFTFDAADEFNLPWLGWDVKIPTTGGYYSETGYDCILGNLRLVINNQGLITAEVGTIGRNFITGTGGITHVSADEDGQSYLHSGQVSLSRGGDAVDMLGVQLMFNNSVTGFGEEVLIGDYRARRFTARARSCEIRLVELWDAATWRKEILTNNPTGTNWSSSVFQTKTAGADKAFSITATTDMFAAGTTPYKFKLDFDQVNWRLGNPIQLQGGDLIRQEIIGVVATPDDDISGGTYCTATLENLIDDYAP